MKFLEMEGLTSMDFSNLFSALESANEAAQNLINDKESAFDNKLIVKKINLNSPLEIELIATGFGAVYLLVQIFDKINSWSKVSLEKEKLRLENQKLKSELEPRNIKIDDKQIDTILVQLEEMKFKLDKIEVNPLDNIES